MTLIVREWNESKAYADPRDQSVEEQHRLLCRDRSREQRYDQCQRVETMADARQMDTFAGDAESRAELRRRRLRFEQPITNHDEFLSEL